LARFVTFLGASQLDASAVQEPLLRARIRAHVLKGLDISNIAVFVIYN
jgi:hypothetical protein